MSPSPQADRFRRTADGFAAVLATVPAGRWESASPCPTWTARDVVAHVINESRRILATVHGVQPEPLHGVAVADMGALPQLSPDADLSAAWKEISEGLTAAIDDPECLRTKIPTFAGPMPFADTVDAVPEDVLIHTWDLAHATGGNERLDAEVVAHVYEHLKPMDEQLRQPWAFGPQTPVPPGADLQTEFLCFVGRQP